MSELKSFIVLYDGHFIRVYEESEADKVIADLEESHKMEVGQLWIEIANLKKACNDKDDWCRHTLKENRHHKHKRCLANAEMCMHKRWRTDEGFDYARSTRHMNKWLELAEQFKPNNSTDQ